MKNRVLLRAQAQAKSGVAQVGFPFRFGMVKPIYEVLHTQSD